MKLDRSKIFGKSCEDVIAMGKRPIIQHFTLLKQNGLTTIFRGLMCMNIFKSITSSKNNGVYKWFWIIAYTV